MATPWPRKIFEVIGRCWFQTQDLLPTYILKHVTQNQFDLSWEATQSHIIVLEVVISQSGTHFNRAYIPWRIYNQCTCLAHFLDGIAKVIYSTKTKRKQISPMYSRKGELNHNKSYYWYQQVTLICLVHVNNLNKCERKKNILWAKKIKGIENLTNLCFRAYMANNITMWTTWKPPISQQRNVLHHSEVTQKIIISS